MRVRERPKEWAVVAYCSGTGWRGWKRVPKASKVRRRVGFLLLLVLVLVCFGRVVVEVEVNIARREWMDLMGSWFVGWQGRILFGSRSDTYETGTPRSLYHYHK